MTPQHTENRRSSLFAPRGFRGKPQGFALLITITLLAFLVLLLVSLASLTRVETQVASNNQTLSQARQNALLALNIALGQLQKYTGPDQRVTARAEILDTDALNRVNTTGVPDINGQPVIDGVPHPYWTGVWDSSKWHPLTGVYDGLTGLRGRQKPAPTAWLVSGNENVGDKFTPTTALSPAGKQTLVNGVKPDGSVDMTTARVEVPAVEITSSAVAGVAGPQIIGHYAYWVGDEGVKAKINTVALAAVADAASSGSGSVATANYYWKAMSPTRAGGEQMLASTGSSLTASFPNFSQIFTADTTGVTNRALLREVVTPSQLAFMQTGSPAASMLPVGGLRIHAFDLTTASAGVLSDTVRGGLRLDLTRYLETGSTDGAFTATDSIYSDAGLSGGRQPSYALLKSWYDIGRGLGAGFTASSAMQSETVSGNTITRMGLFPAITTYQLAYSAMCPGPGSPAQLLIQPSLTLWNPHNVTLPAEDLVLELEENLIIQMAVENRSDDGTPIATPTAYLTTQSRIGNDPLAPRIGGYVRVRLKGVELAPGETVVYSLAGTGGAVAPAVSDSASLSSFPEMIPQWTNANFIAVPMLGLTLKPTPLNPGEHLEYVMARMNVTPVPDSKERYRFKARSYRAADYAARTALQIFEGPSSQADPSSLNAATPFSAPLIPPYVLGSTPPSDTRQFRTTSVVMRLPASRGGAYITGSTANQTAAVFAQFNLRGAYDGLTSFDSYADLADGDPFFASGRSFQTLPALSVVPGAGKDLAFAGPHATDKGQGNRYVMFDYPRAATAVPGNGGYPAVISLGEFQHADLSSYTLQPTYVFGNSWPDPRLGRESVSGRWSGFAPATASQALFAGNDYLLRDVSYLANHALWDRFFLSTIPQNSGGGSSAFNASVSLPNTRMRAIEGMVPGNDGFPTFSEVRSVSKAAGSLLLDGAFNINSTSVAAWRAFLGGLSGVPVSSGGASPAGSVSDPTSSGLKNNYSRFLLPLANAFASNSSTFSSTNQNGAVSPAAWTGSRYLTDDELDTLARNLVEEVKVRGPFMSIADFVNRRLITAADDNATTVTANVDEHRKKVGALGAIQKAILNLNPAASGTGVDLSKSLNASLNEPLMGSATFTFGGVTAQVFSDSGTSAWRSLSTSANAYPSQRELLNGGLVAQFNFGIPGFLTQADVLQKIGGAISARSDTFVIRTYGDVRNPATGATEGRAWCEAVVQRLPEYLDASASQPPEAGSSAAGSAALNATNQTFGRRYTVVSFRWLSAADL